MKFDRFFLKKVGYHKNISLIVLYFIFAMNINAFALNNCDIVHSVLSKAEHHQNSQYFEEAISLCPDYIKTYEQYGNFSRKNGENSKAIELFKKAEELGSTNFKLYYLLATLLYEKDLIDEAYKAVVKSLALKNTYKKSISVNSHIKWPC